MDIKNLDDVIKELKAISLKTFSSKDELKVEADKAFTGWTFDGSHYLQCGVGHESAMEQYDYIYWIDYTDTKSSPIIGIKIDKTDEGYKIKGAYNAELPIIQ